MSINAIYACKLYKASSRKDKIRAAAQNPLNSELVTQLNEYLDDEYQAANAEALSQKHADLEDVPENEEKIRPSEHSAAGGGGGHFSGGGDFGGGDAFGGEPDSSEPSLSEEVADAESAKLDEMDEVAVGESTKVNKSTVTASSDIYVADEVDAIIGLLNSREDTTGVCRGIVKDTELWLHYNDNTNLNNVMEPVIAVLNASNYNMLDFNRLARTENAIVFSISEGSRPVQPLEETDAE